MPSSFSRSRGGELLVEQRAARADVVHLAGRLEDGRRAFAVRTLDRRNALAQGLPGLATVGRRPGHLPEIDMDGGRQQVDAVFAALGGGPAVDGLEIGFEDRLHNRIGVVVVVAILGGLVEQTLAQVFFSGEILLQGLQEVLHGDGLFVEDVEADSRQDVAHRA